MPHVKTMLDQRVLSSEHLIDGDVSVSHEGAVVLEGLYLFQGPAQTLHLHMVAPPDLITLKKPTNNK